VATRRPQAALTGDVFEPHADGTITIGWDGQPEFTIRCPKAGEIRSYLNEGKRGDDWKTEPALVDPDDPKAGTRAKTILDLMAPDSPYLALYVRIFAELGGVTISPESDDLPGWLFDAGTVREMSAHWQANPLTRGAVARLRGTGTL
jgi:hypothetical protein